MRHPDSYFIYSLLYFTMKKDAFEIVLSEETVLQKIFWIRGQKVMLDKDLAALYGVTTRRLKEQVRRNISRFLRILCLN